METIKRAESIHEPSIGYNLLRSYVMFGLRFFYKRIQIIGAENIPYNSNLIITPNHQNALMDAMAVLFGVKKSRIVFMARADIFKNKRQEKMLTYFKMLPIYRMRDGAQELAKNEEIFERSVRIVADRVPLCLMPEGNHGGKRRLRNFVKGAFRIAFRAKEEVGPEKDVLILPVGIDFQHYQKFNQNLLIVIGKPVSVNEYFPAYNENQPIGINALRDRIAEDMRKLIIHIANEEIYDMYQNLRHIWNGRMKQICGIRGNTLYHSFRADKTMIRILDQAWEEEPDSLRGLSFSVEKYMKKLHSLNMRNWVVARKGFSLAETFLMMLRILITAPLGIYGMINNVLPFYLPVRLTRKIKDPQFVSSFKFVLSILIFPAFYLIQTLLVGLISGSGLIALAYIISLPLSGYYSLYWSFWIKKLSAALRYRWLTARKDKQIDEIGELYISIMKTMENICSKFLQKMPVNKTDLHD